MKKKYLLIGFIAITGTMAAQNVGIGTTTPVSKLHIKGSADVSQLIIDANSTQSNTKPLIKLRRSDGTDLMWIYSDDGTNSFIGLNAGRVNNAGGGGTFNTFVGSSAGYSNTTGHDNTASGDGALLFNTTGYENIATGGQALAFNTTGYSNTASGYHTLYSNITGIFNTANGSGALYLNSTGSNNTANGYQALFSNTTGYDNTATGIETLYTNTTGSSNTASGNMALYNNTTGTGNTAGGNMALYYNTKGYDNTASGTYALYYNSTASQNIAIGSYALREQSFSNGGVFWSSGNVAVGYAALYSNQPTSTSNGINNTAVGNFALNSNTTGAYNTSNGYQALYSNNTGFDNTANGYQALYSNNTGFDNTANGSGALYSNTTGYYNTANGSDALFNNNTAYYNTATGASALLGTTTGAYNTAYGANALKNNIGGYQNIAIGYEAGTHSSTPNIYNTISIGNDGILNAYQNQAMIGNLSTAWIGGKVTWSTYSDSRIKNNVMEDVKGLEFILRLRPVTYHISNKSITTITGNKETPDFPGKYDGEKVKYTGFLAQEVEQAAKAANYDFSGYQAPKNQWGLYTISYEQFVVPLVKAVQELSEQTVTQKKIIEQQQLQYEILLKRIEALEKKN